MKTKNPISKLIVLVFIALATSMTFSSCKDECKDVDCLNGGTCSDGDCNCADGYEGSNCGTESRAKYFGSYNTINEMCASGGPSVFSITITTNSGGINKITMNNLYDANLPVVATLSGSSVTIASQAFGTGSISGSGSFTGNILTLSYTVSGGGSSDACTVSFTKI